MRVATPALLLLLAGTAAADGPAFDRPGIAFAPSVLPTGGVDWEQGLPDLSRDRSDGVTTTLYTADTLLRAALTDRFELQLGTALANRMEVRDDSGTHRDDGRGDSSIAVKMAVPASSQRLSAAVIARVTAATGDAAFSGGTTQYTLGGSAGWSLPDGMSLGMFAQATRAGPQYTYTLSPSLGFAVSDNIGVFMEEGSTHVSQAGNSHIAGGGLTWMVTPTVQLDVSADRGLTRASTDLQAGFGISAFFN